MNLSALFNALQRAVTVQDTDGGVENRVTQEVHTDAP